MLIALFRFLGLCVACCGAQAVGLVSAAGVKPELPAHASVLYGLRRAEGNPRGATRLRRFDGAQ